MSIDYMGPRPAVSDCRCHICAPPPLHEAIRPDAEADAELGCIGTVLRAGWQVMLVSADGPCDCCGTHPQNDVSDDPVDPEAVGMPTFAYTIGLTHRAGHPELAMSGLPPDLMHHVLNYVADRVVRHGHRVRPGDAIEGALATAPLTVDRVSERGLRDIGTWSAWFHREPVDALQLVWPTVSGVFAWQPGAPPELDQLQPPSWRVATPRSGAFAADPPWPLPVPPDHPVIVCTHVREGEPIRFAARYRDADGEQWDIHCGRDHGDGIDELHLEHAAHAVRAAPSLRLIADLREGECAFRADAFASWQREML